ncbi:MAG: peptide-methionine (S)-S-oxide reductase MsrA [Vulcanimicrobiaceae bacterium]
MKLSRLAFAALIAASSLLGATPSLAAQPTQRIVLAGGCFWGMQAVFERLNGVVNTTVGYAGGSADTANYDAVSSDRTRHAEVVAIDYNPHVISTTQLLRVFFLVAHDPTQVGHEGPDYGPQYRSEIFYTTAAQQQTAQTVIAAMTRAHTFSAPISTKIAHLTAFYRAESYHQHYADKHPDDGYIVYNDDPKIKALQAKFPSLIRKH